MNNKFILLKHSKTIIDQNLPVSEWELEEEGLKKLNLLLTNPDFKNIDIIYASTEKKAIKTAEVFSKNHNLDIKTIDDFRELDRDKGEFGTQNSYLDLVSKTVKNRNQSFNNWETAQRALTRFSNGINKINAKYNNKIILIVSHGIILNLYFADLKGKINQTYEFWLTVDFCDYGIIQNEVIIKDISKLSK
jgi:broad specificity phosphatase PhoE